MSLYEMTLLWCNGYVAKIYYPDKVLQLDGEERSKLLN